MALFWYALIVILTALSGFLVHVLTLEMIQPWVSLQMTGTKMIPGWEVKYIAMVTSVEYGVAALLMYILFREKVLKYGKGIAILCMAGLMLGLHGALFRQPFMDFVIGNPIHVTLVQNGAKWLLWTLMAVIIVLGVEWVKKR